jgi:hypothetical protein
MSPNHRRIGILAAIVVVLGGVGSAAAQQLPQPVVGQPGGLLANGGFDAGDRAGHRIGWSVLGAGGAPIPGYSSQPITGKQVQFRFSLTNADLYSYWVAG